LSWSSPIAHRLAVLFAGAALLISADTPDFIPIPQPRPEAAPAPVKKEEVKPKAPQPAATPTTGKAEPGADAAPPETPVKPLEEVYVPPPIEKENPAKYAACLSDLKAMGVEFTEISTIADDNGCGIDKPIKVANIGGGVALKPDGVMRCETAASLAHWTADVVKPTLKLARPGESLSGLDQASTYICRKRNSAQTGKISEHAHGNAVDIAVLRFKSGEAFSIKPRMKDSTMDGALQRAITASACLYFTTVLDPGSDAAHETHLHLDIIQRKNQYRLCW